jgi:hypothetical protein
MSATRRTSTRCTCWWRAVTSWWRTLQPRWCLSSSTRGASRRRWATSGARGSRPRPLRTEPREEVAQPGTPAVEYHQLQEVSVREVVSSLQVSTLLIEENSLCTKGVTAARSFLSPCVEARLVARTCEQPGGRRLVLLLRLQHTRPSQTHHQSVTSVTREGSATDAGNGFVVLGAGAMQKFCES